MRFIRRTAPALIVACFAAATLALHAQEEGNPYRQLRYRFIGPDGNRAIAVVGEPGNPLVTYVGAASGGIFKTADGGTTWRPIFDHYGVASVGSLAIDPQRHNIVWAGTGETFLIRPDNSMGNGIYRSDDAGATWRRMGLEKTGRIGRVVIDPHDPDTVFACALGHSFGPQHERGIYRTRDGGATWQQVLFVDENTGCADIAIDPNHPQVLFAGMWPLTIKTWGLTSGGPAGGVYVSRDGGTSWHKLSGHGLPAADHPIGKTAVAVAPSDSRRVYALLEDTTPGFYRSEDGGATWTLVNQQHVLAERAPYYTRFAVSPDDENRLYFASVSWSVSTDGGDTLLESATRAGGDNHDIWIDPTNASRILVANDAGASVSLNKGKTYEHVVLPIAQMYHVYTDNQIPYFVYGNRQDGGSYRGPSNSLQTGFGPLVSGGIPLGLWRSVGGCESGFGIPDPVDNNIVWSGCYDGQLDRTDLATGEARSVQVWPDATYGWAPADVKYRWHWTFPIAISPHDHNTVYVGSQVVHRTTDGGNSWTVISPDLTTNDKTHQQNSGGITTDNLMTWDGATLYAIAESPVEKGLIWTGSNDGQINLTRDAGKTWTNVTKNLPDLPPWGTVSNIEPSRFDAGTAYATIDLHQVGNFDPFVYKTSDYGRAWTLISASVPKSESSYAHVVREDPVRKGMLYLGTDNALYVTWDDGAHWTSLQNNLPPAPVYWLTIQERFSDLVVATYGRGFWILDDVTPLRAMNDQIRNVDAHLFEPRPAYRFRSVQGIHVLGGSPIVGRNPPYGASIDYYLKTPAAGGAEITVIGPKGETIRTMKGSAEAGLNRAWWDLRYDPNKRAELRTAPPGEPWVSLGPDGSRPLVTWGRGVVQPTVAPGKYTVKVKVGTRELSAPLTVLKDPHSGWSEQDIARQVALGLELRDEINGAVDMINQIEWRRRQLEDAQGMYASEGKEAERKAAKAAEEKLIGVEGRLFDLSLTGHIEDSFRHPMKLYGRIVNLAQNLLNGTDAPPTTQQVQVNEEFKKRLDDARRQYRIVLDTLPAPSGRQ
ncbi:MAG: WD40/YVTN/BNR-like repeat-containing protein [Betaproteobacteria bacterium]